MTVVDATCSRISDIKDYKKLADQYGYELLVVDFTTVPLDICLAQNKMRPTYKYVPEDVIRAMYARYATQEIPDGIVVIKNYEPLKGDTKW